MIKRGKIVAITLAVLLTSSISISADTLSEQLQRQQSQLQQDKNLLKGIEEQKEETEIKIQKLDVQIEELMDNIEENKNQISSNEKEIGATELQVLSMEENVEEEKELMGQRVRAMYKNGTDEYISALVESRSFSDLVSRLQWIKKIMDFDKKMIKSLEEKKAELNRKKEELNRKREELVQLKKSNEQKLVSMNDAAVEQKKLIEEFKAQERIYSSRITESQSLVDSTMSQIRQIRNAAPKYVPSRGAAPISDNAIIAYASNFLGTPYVWGGTRPDPGFDCSGFTQYVYAHFGIKVGRTTKDQIHDGAAVSKSELQVGDLVFFGDDGIPNHMGIYAGSNTYIHAPQTGDVVKISPMTRRDFITGRRVK